MNARKARKRRKQRAATARRAEVSPTTRDLLQKARVKRDKRLGAVATEYRGKVQEVLDEAADRRRQVWRDFEAERDVVLRNDREPAEAK